MTKGDFFENKTANSQQPTANSQQPTANSQQPISIIVPIYKVEKYFHRCIDSILEQTFTDFECILVDDASPDNCPKLCDEYAKKFECIKTIHNECNKGVSQSRKIGLDKSVGEYILFVDSDDYLEKDMVEKMYEKAISEKLDVVCCDYLYENGEDIIYAKQTFSSFEKVKIIKNILSIKIKSVLWNKLVKRNIYTSTFFPEYNRSEDYVITIQAVYHANKIGYIRRALYHYCFNEYSLSNNKNTSINGRIEENKNWCYVVNILREKYGSDLTQFEPELSEHINDFKYAYLLNKQLRKNKELFKLYPESKFVYFILKRYIHKIVLLCTPPIIIKLLLECNRRISGK